MPTIVQSVNIRRVDDPDERVGLLEVITPVGAQCSLAADVPYRY